MFLVPKNACKGALIRSPLTPGLRRNAAHREASRPVWTTDARAGDMARRRKGGARVARPKKQMQDARTERLNLRLQPDERAEVETRAVALGLTPSDYARRLIIGGRLANVVTVKADPSLVLAINRAGVNLNQIARTMNSGAGHIPLDLADTLERINRLLDRLQEDE